MALGDDLRGLRADERAAAKLLHDRLGASLVRPRDVPGGPERTHDFDLVGPAGLVAVEVTTAADGLRKSLWHQVEARDWTEPSLLSSWALTVDSNARVRRIRHSAPPLLAVLERQEVGKFGSGRILREPTAAVAAQALAALGVIGGISVKSTPTKIVLSVVGPSGWGGADLLAEIVEERAAAKVSQLERAEAAERHLFIWLDWTSSEGQIAVSSVMRQGCLPRSPQLPTVIDRVWLAPESLVDGGSFLWSVGGDGVWDIDLPPQNDP